MSVQLDPTPLPACADPRLEQALEYVLGNPGKRLRSQLTLTTFQLVSGAEPPAAVHAVATAIEWLHTYSLIHDDLPAMDDDDLRRGVPTAHRAFDEATAILVGDGLQAEAFALIAGEDGLDFEQRTRLIGLIAGAVGFSGMVGGQALDMAAENQAVPLEQLQNIHHRKTGALIRAAVLAGALCARGDDEVLERLDRFAHCVGLAFQVADDILDATGSANLLGKTPGKDAAAHKSTYVSCLGLEEAKASAGEWLARAETELDHFGDHAGKLRELARRMVLRDS